MPSASENTDNMGIFVFRGKEYNAVIRELTRGSYVCSSIARDVYLP